VGKPLLNGKKFSVPVRDLCVTGEFFHPEHWMVIRKPNLLHVYPSNGISGNPFKLQVQGSE